MRFHPDPDAREAYGGRYVAERTVRCDRLARLELPGRVARGEGKVVYAAVFRIVERVFERVFLTVSGNWKSYSVLFGRRKSGVRSFPHRVVDEEGEERMLYCVLQANEKFGKSRAVKRSAINNIRTSSSRL